MFPRGLVLGRVMEVKASEYDVSYYALVKPYVDIPNITDVFVITEFEGQGEAAASIFDEDTDQTGGGQE